LNQRPSGYEPDELPLLHPAPMEFLVNSELFLYSACSRLKTSTISTAQLNRLLCLHTPPIKQVVFLRSYSRRTGMRDLILEQVSRLDAFSAYPNQTWLPSTAVGTTTGTPEVCPSQSSRTRESPPQISCAHNG
jgi:hypothetical protein